MTHPRGLYVLFLTEMWERFSYYGMRALLVLYMVQGLGLSVPRAAGLYGLYTGMVYLTPALGGLLADRYLGQHRAVLAGGALMALGHFAMMLSPTPCFYAALGLIVLGCGLFKPSISVQVGGLYAADDPRRDAAFGIFYMGINLGGALAPLVCGTLGQRLGWHWGFGAAGVGMLLGLAAYVAGRRHLQPYGAGAPACPPVIGTSDALDPTLRARAPRLPPGARRAPPVPMTRVQRQQVAALLLLAVFGNVAFWATFEQAGTSMTLFAEQSTQLVLPLVGRVPSSWFQVANPLFITLLTPLFALGWAALRRAQLEPATPQKFVVGLVFVALGFGVMVQAGARADAGGCVSPLWLLGAYFLNTCGELCISPVGLSVVTRLAPPAVVSLMMGLWLASMAVANFLGGQLAGTYGDVAHATFFVVPAALAAGAAVLLLALVAPLRRLMHGVH